MMVCKQILGVQKQTTSIGVLLELGRVPIYLHAIKIAIKNWERIKKGNTNTLALSSYYDAMKENLPWISSIKKYLEVNGMLNNFINTYENKPPFIYNKIFQTLSDGFYQNAFENIGGEQSKLRTYALFKTNIGFEKYLIKIRNPIIRTQITKLRLSNHNLMIETGRFTNIKRELRFCPFCPVHFCLECPTYKLLISEMFTILNNSNPAFKFYTEKDKFRYLLSNTENYGISHYIFKSLSVRTFLLTNPTMSN